MTKYLPTQTNSDFCVVIGQTKTSIKNSFLARLYFLTSIVRLSLSKIRLTKSVLEGLSKIVDQFLWAMWITFILPNTDGHKSIIF